MNGTSTVQKEDSDEEELYQLSLRSIALHRTSTSYMIKYVQCRVTRALGRPVCRGIPGSNGLGRNTDAYDGWNVATKLPTIPSRIPGALRCFKDGHVRCIKLRTSMQPSAPSRLRRSGCIWDGSICMRCINAQLQYKSLQRWAEQPLLAVHLSAGCNTLHRHFS
jgi:hypothetical protein